MRNLPRYRGRSTTLKGFHIPFQSRAHLVRRYSYWNHEDRDLPLPKDGGLAYEIIGTFSGPIFEVALPRVRKPYK